MNRLKPSTILLLIGCIAIWGVFLFFVVVRTQETPDPILQLYGERFEVYQNTEIDYLSYVKMATDYQGNNIKDADHITYNAIDNVTIGPKTVTYTLTDDNGNQVSESLEILILSYTGPTTVGEGNADVISSDELESIITGEAQGGM